MNHMETDLPASINEQLSDVFEQVSMGLRQKRSAESAFEERYIVSTRISRVSVVETVVYFHSLFLFVLFI